MSTSRLSYTSSPESGLVRILVLPLFISLRFPDGEFCGEDTPRRSAQLASSRDRGSTEASSRLARASSDPSLARQDGTIKSEPGEVIPDYSQPPPYSTQQQQQQPAQEGKRRSHGGDSKYGFPNKQQGGGGAEEFPPPPPQAAPPQSSGYSSGNFRSSDRYGSLNPADGASPPDKRSQSQPATTVPQGKGKKEVPGPVLPPKIDRQKKPSKKSAQNVCLAAAVRRRRSETARKILSQTGTRRGQTSHQGGRRGVMGMTACRHRRAARRTPTTATHPVTLTRTTSTMKCLVMPTAGPYPSPQRRHITRAHAL